LTATWQDQAGGSARFELPGADLREAAGELAVAGRGTLAIKVVLWPWQTWCRRLAQQHREIALGIFRLRTEADSHVDLPASLGAQVDCRRLGV
jgi:hypothetical protein